MKSRNFGFFLACLIGFSFFLSAPAQAEWYVGGYGGWAFHSDQDIDIGLGAFGLSGTDTFKNVDLNSSVVFGGKIGYYSEGLPQPRVGVELDIAHFNADTDQQIVLTNLFPGGVGIAASETRVTSIAVNLLFRYSVLQNRFQPYFGGGVGFFIADFETTVITEKKSDIDTAIGLQGIVGAHYYLIKPVSVFTEYKFVYTDEFEFELHEGPLTGTAEVSLLSHLLYGGIAYHF